MKEEAIIEAMVAGVRSLYFFLASTNHPCCAGSALQGCIFVGHIVTDTDSIATAVGAAHLFGGQPARAERELNGEIKRALEYACIDTPPYFADVEGAMGERGVCLVDHNAATQVISRDCSDPEGEGG